LTQLFAIAIGGAVGAVARYGVATGVYHVLGRDFPYGTLVVNVLGSLIMGFLYVWFVERSAVGPEWRAMILIGLLGSFTTFSTFSIETLSLVEDHAYAKAFLNIGLSVILCLAAVSSGVVIGRRL